MLDQKSCCSPVAKPIQITLPKKDNTKLPVAIIGGGPIGLAAAAHLAKADENFVLLEAGPSIGHNVQQWGHVRLFSPWRFNIDKAARGLLEKAGWKAPAEDGLPTGSDLVQFYLLPLAELPGIKPFIRTNTKVVGIGRKGQDKMKTGDRDHLPFMIHTEGDDGKLERFEAKAVIDASGTWNQPNPANASGIWTRQERELKDKIFYNIADIQGMADEKFKGKHIAVAGGGHSAINTILDLSELEGVKISWILRKKRIEEAYGGEEKDALQARGELGARIHQLVDSGKVDVFTPFRIEQVKRSGDAISLEGEWKGDHYVLGDIDTLYVNAGSRPDFSTLSEIRLNIDPVTESSAQLAPLIDPNLHSCGTVRPHGESELRQPEKDFYIAGMKSYGRAPTFLMATGYEQVRSIVAYLTGNLEAAKEVELELPETGVCSLTLNSAAASCC
jgi:thioredoxin reductase